jgi:hypothetical protein
MQAKARPDLARELATRPAIRLLDRLLPEPMAAPLAKAA